MKNINVQYEISSPLFMGGADPKKEAEFRISGLNGVLRFWYRALAWCRYNGKIRKIKHEEIDLFGGMTSDGVTAKRAFNYKTTSKNLTSRENPQFNNKDIEYLGYGAVDSGDEKGMKCIEKWATINITLNFWRRVKDENYLLLCEALKCLGLLGGIGSRSRNGFGSLTLLSLSNGENIWSPPTNRQELQSEIEKIRPDSCPEKYPDFTAFGPDFRFSIGNESAKPYKVLESAGKKLKDYRKAFNINDAGEVRKALRGGPSSCPKRAIFGLPHNYFFKEDSLKAQVTGEEHDRRASPLFIHVHKLNTNSYVAVWSIFPSVFLPGNSKILIQDQDKPSNKLVVNQPDYNILKRLVN